MALRTLIASLHQKAATPVPHPPPATVVRYRTGGELSEKNGPTFSARSRRFRLGAACPRPGLDSGPVDPLGGRLAGRQPHRATSASIISPAGSLPTTPSARSRR